MNAYRKLIILTAAAITAVAAYPQESNDGELQKSIVIEKDFVPVETDAKKMDVLPQEAPFTAVRTELSFSDWAVPATVEPMLLRQAAMKYSDPSLAPYRKRGYAGFAAGNYLNMVGSAGYRFIDNDRMQLGAWFQHNSTNGGINGIEENEHFFHKQFVSDDKLSLDFSNRFEKGILNANASYHYEKFNYYGTPIAVDQYHFSREDFLRPGNKKQTVNELNINLIWQNNTDNNVHYYAGIDFNYFGHSYGSALIDYELTPDNRYKRQGFYFPDGLKEYHGTVTGGIDLGFGENSRIGIDAKGQFLNYDNLLGHIVMENAYRPGLSSKFITPVNSEHFGMLSLTPYYSKKTDRMNLRIGARLDISFNNGTVFRIAPDVRFDLAMSDKAGLFVSATGGNHINTFHETSAVNRYLAPSFLLPTSYTVIDARAGLNFGLWRGLSMTPYVGFAVTKDHMLPTIDNSINHGYPRNMIQDDPYYIPETNNYDVFKGQVIYEGFDTNGVIAGIKFGYKFKDILELSADYAFTPQGDDSGYILSDDRPEHTVRAVAKVRPIKPLSIVLDYELRALRSVHETIRNVDPVDFTFRYIETIRPYSNISNLNLGVSYQINDMISVFCQGNNLLNRRYENYYGIYAQEINILGGIGVNF